MKRNTGTILILFCMAALMLLSGCMSVTAEELYRLPEISENNRQLQSTINAVLNSGAEFLAPTAGANRQSVQLQDLDGDGVAEALAFFSFPEDRPLRMYILKRQGGAYETAAVIEGEGTAFERVIYTDMDGDGISELIVGWKMGTSLQLMTVYSVKDLKPTALHSMNYNTVSVCDMNSDGCDDIVVFRMAGADSSSEAECISLAGDGEIVSSTALISEGIESISRTTFGTVEDHVPALFVDSVYGGNGLVTDVIVWDQGLENITMGSSSPASFRTVRDYNVFCSDINGDGVVEVPMPRTLWSQSETVYRVLDWMAFDSVGRDRLVMTTYHSYSDGWYLILPEDWGDSITVRRADSGAGERTLMFSYYAGTGEPVDFLRIYTISGENRDERAKLAGRFILKYSGDTIYAAAITSEAGELPLSISQEEISAGFHIIYSDWKTGS